MSDVVIRVVKAKIEKLRYIDAVVTSTNVNLHARGKTDVAIHKRAGAELENRCNELAPISVAVPIITEGFELRYKYIVHVVAPNFKDKNSENLLVDSYQKSIRLAVESGAKSVAFPIIGIGYHGWKTELGIPVAIKAITTCDEDVLGQLDCIYLVTPQSEVYRTAMEIAAANGIKHSHLNIELHTEIDNIDYQSVISYFTKLALKKNLNGVTKIVDTILGDNKKVCDLLGNAELNRFVRGKIAEALYKKGIFVNIKELQGIPDNNGIKIRICADNLEYEDVISFINRIMSKSSNVYKNKLVPVVLDAIQTSVSDEIKTALLLEVLNNLPNEVVDKIADKITKKTGMIFCLKNPKCTTI